MEPQYSQPLNSIGRRQISRRVAPLASSPMDLYANISDRSEIAASVESTNTTSGTVKSSNNFSASVNVAGVAGSLATDSRGSGGEITSLCAARFFGF